MSLNSAIFTILSGNAAVTGVIGTKIFPQRAAQETAYPFVVYNTISTELNPTLGATGKSTMDRHRVQFSIISETQAEADSIQQIIRNVLDYYCIVPTTVSGTVIQNIALTGGSNYFDNTAGQEGIYINNSDYIFTITP